MLLLFLEMQGQYKLVPPQQPDTFRQLFSILRTAAQASQCVSGATRSSELITSFVWDFQQRRSWSTRTPQQKTAAVARGAGETGSNPTTATSRGVAAASQLQHRLLSNSLASTSHRCDRRFSATASCSFASQPALAFSNSRERSLLGLQELADAAEVLPVILHQSAVLPRDPKLELAPWDISSAQRGYKQMRYRKEVLSTEKWTWSGSRSDIPFIGRSRFDPRTLHGPWMEGGASHADLEAHVDELAALPRTHLFLDLPQLPPPEAAPPPEAQGAGENQEPRKRSRGRPKREHSAAAVEAAEQLAAAAARFRAEALAAAEKLASQGEEQQARPAHPDDTPRRRLQNLSHTLPDVLRALRCVGLDADKPLEAALLRALSRADPDARPRPRTEPADKGTPALLITPGSAQAMAAFFLKDLPVPPRQLRKLLKRAPWVLALNPRQQAQPVVECLRHMVHLPDDKIVRMVMRHPRTLVAQVDEHLLPLLDYMQTLGFSPRHTRRIFSACPLFVEGFSTRLLRTSVAFWLGKGMARENLAGFIAQYPKVTSLSQSTTQLKYDWLKEHIEYGVEDHARNPILLSRSLTDNLGPRILFAQHQGFQVVRPTEPRRRRGGEDKVVSAKEVTQIGFDRFLARLGSSAEEYLAFKGVWDSELLPRWLAAHNCEIGRAHV